MKRILIATVVLGLFACGNPQVIQTLEQQSVGQIPCNAEHIEVIEHVEVHRGERKLNPQPV